MNYSTLNTLYNLFLVLTVVFFLISILLFFVFDIRRVFMIRSGKAAKRDIKKLEDESFRTGRLSRKGVSDMYDRTGSFDYSEEFGKTEQVSANELDNASVTQQTTTPTTQSTASTEETTVLGNAGETTVLGNVGETTVLSGNAATAVATRKFEIKRKEIHIHTDEVI